MIETAIVISLMVTMGTFAVHRLAPKTGTISTARDAYVLNTTRDANALLQECTSIKFDPRNELKINDFVARYKSERANMHAAAIEINNQLSDLDKFNVEQNINALDDCVKSLGAAK